MSVEVEPVLASICDTASATTHERHAKVPKLVPQVLDRVQADQGGDKHADPFHTVPKTPGQCLSSLRHNRLRSLSRLGILVRGGREHVRERSSPKTYEQTQPIEIPVKVSQIHQSSSNGLRTAN